MLKASNSDFANGGRDGGAIAATRFRSQNKTRISTSWPRAVAARIKGLLRKRKAGKIEVMQDEESLMLHRIMDESLNEIFIADADTLEVIYANAGALNNMGFEMEELAGMTLEDFSPGRTKSSLLRLLAPLHVKDEQIMLEGKNLRKDGTVYDVETKIHFSRAGGRPVYVAIVEDVTEKRAAANALQQSSKMEALGQLTGGVAHDFNNLLTAIIGGLSVMDGMKIPDEARPILEMALGAARRGSDLTSRLLAYSRKQELRPVQVETNRLIEDMGPLLKTTMGDNIEVAIEPTARKHHVYVDHQQIENAILNMAINSRDAMPSGGKLEINVLTEKVSSQLAARNNVKPGNYVIIEVADTGVGMSPQVIEKAFDPFFTTKDVGKGTGLGLSLVVGIVQQSGGFVKLTSKIGKGTTFRLYLPRLRRGDLKRHEREADRTRLEKAGSEGKKILVVERDDEILGYAEKVLRAHKHDILKAKDLREAKELFESHERIDLLLTDVELGCGGCGRELGDEFAQIYPDGRILFCADGKDRGHKINGKCEFNGNLLMKPYQPTALLMTVEKMFA